MHSKINSLKDNLKIVTKHSSSSIIESAAELTEKKIPHLCPRFWRGKKRKHRKVKVRKKKDAEL